MEVGIGVIKDMVVILMVGMVMVAEGLERVLMGAVLLVAMEVVA